MILLAIDPGFDRIGIALFEKEKHVKELILHSECFTTNKKETHTQRLFALQKRIRELIDTYVPTHMATELLFFTNNQKTALSVAEAKGVILCLAGEKDLILHEYTPLQIKSAVAGHGKATKDQVQKMVYRMTSLPKEKRLDDEIDAIAIGLTCFAYERY